jgi:acetoacetyl-CoA synthetase
MSILWQPSRERIDQTNLSAFQRYLKDRFNVEFENYEDLHRWSISETSGFWDAVWDFCGVIAAEKGEVVFEQGHHMIGSRFFPEASLNFTENLLRRRDDSDAIVFRSESGYQSHTSWRQLNDIVTKLAGRLTGDGIQPGDRIAACLPNIPETIIATLSTAAVGATWSSCSPDFGEQGILDRFQQIAPRILLTSDGYYYGGKRFDIRKKIASVVGKIPSLEKVIVIPFLGTIEGQDVDCSGIPHGITLNEYLSGIREDEMRFQSFPFAHHLYIMFSSGTTGVPKCIVHGAGGTLLQHLKEHKLHCDIKPGDRTFFFTTCGWMMWNWLVTMLASEATIMLYDGSPFHPHDSSLFDYAEKERISFFGTSAKYIQTAEKRGLTPVNSHKLPALKTIASTGSPLLPENFDYVYRSIKSDVCLSSISGGTDIVSCFVLGNPNDAVRRGEIQAKGLGMAVDVWDDEGNSIIDGKGELVCTQAHPCMPVGFWNDDNNKNYMAAYFSKYPGIWAHGDFAELTSNGGFIIYGRSDAVLNPGGVRIGTAEIYRQVESFEEVMESVAVSQETEGDNRILLFVVLKPGHELDDKLIDKIKSKIRNGTSPRHVPARIYQVPDIPRTRSGKITELAIRDVIHGLAVKNSEAIANPESLDNFRTCMESDS